MSFFLLACAGLVLLSGLFYLFPKVSGGASINDSAAANREWYQLRKSELLAEGQEVLQSDIDLRMLEDDSQALPVDTETIGQGAFPRWLLLPLIALLASVLYYQLGAAPDVLIDKQLQSLTDSSAPEEIEALVKMVETRAAQRPENAHYSALLGSFYMGEQDYKRAATLYGGLVQEAPGDAQALAMAAQAEYLASDRTLTERAQMFAEQALAIDPHQRTALGLLGMASFEQQQYRAAIEYWERLVAMEPPGSESAMMIGSVIATARERLGLVDAEGDSVVQNEIPPPVAVSAGVTVRVTLPEGVKINSDDTVFVLARNAFSDSRMPVAVQRLPASALPVTIRLDDSSSMAGQKLSALESIVVIVQVSPDGRPGEASATWLGRAGPLAPSESSEPLVIELSAAGS